MVCQQKRTNPLEGVNREIGRRADVVGIFPIDAFALRVTAALLIKQNDEWLVCRRYLSDESMRLILDATTEPIISLRKDNDQEDIATLAA